MKIAMPRPVDTLATTTMNPQNILLVKAHSMGIGDLLRSSAAWSALKAKWPSAQLHFLMLSNHAGYPSEALIQSHYLLSSVHFVTVKEGQPGAQKQKKRPLAQTLHTVLERLADQAIDLVIDFETGGLKTSWLTRRIARAKRATSVGIAQFPLRRFFYDLAAPSSRDYQALHGLPRLMDYTEKDFVALAALGIQRDDTRITLRPAAEGVLWQQQHAAEFSQTRTVVLNIGCGTADALVKRPPMDSLVQCCAALHALQPFHLHLSGATFERDVNQEFAALFAAQVQRAGQQAQITDWSGQLSLDQLAGLLEMADFAISSDSGPYHMAVALGIPTLCWFNFETPPSYHHHKDVACLVMPQPEAFVGAAQRLLAT
jgi:ADP-heptose:LPS heptosyltransferase